MNIKKKDYEALWDGCWYGAEYKLDQYKEFRRIIRENGRSKCADKKRRRESAKYGWRCRQEYIRLRTVMGLGNIFSPNN